MRMTHAQWACMSEDVEDMHRTTMPCMDSLHPHLLSPWPAAAAALVLCESTLKILLGHMHSSATVVSCLCPLLCFEGKGELMCVQTQSWCRHPLRCGACR